MVWHASEGRRITPNKCGLNLCPLLQAVFLPRLTADSFSPSTVFQVMTRQHTGSIEAWELRQTRRKRGRQCWKRCKQKMGISRCC